MCLCDAAWGGPDCSVDRLVLLQDELMDGVPIEMDFQVHNHLPLPPCVYRSPASWDRIASDSGEKRQRGVHVTSKQRRLGR